MSRSRAAHLARLKVRYQGWRIQERPGGQGYRADSRSAPWQSLEATTVEELEIKLQEVAS